MSLHSHRGDCRLCHATTLEIVLPLRPIPVRTPNLGFEGSEHEQAELDRARAPLDVYRCESCGHLQLLDVVDPRVQYKGFRYRTSVSVGLPQHFRQMARDLVRGLSLEPGAAALEIGSNDGTLLAALHEEGLSILGIDPAREIAQLATQRGVPTLARFFDGECARELREEHGTFELIVANNTLANLDDLDDVARGVRMLLAPDGVFVVETADGGTVMRQHLLDTIYHEHLSYFQARPFARWLERQGLELLRVEPQDTKGGSLRFFAQRAGGARTPDATVVAAIGREASEERDLLADCREFAAEVEVARAALAERISAVRGAGPIAAYGASVGTVTLLTQLDLWDALDYLLDDEPLSEEIGAGEHTLPILPGGELASLAPALVVLLAHRYADVILEKRADYLESGGTFVVPFPRLRLIEAAEARA